MPRSRFSILSTFKEQSAHTCLYLPCLHLLFRSFGAEMISTRNTQKWIEIGITAIARDSWRDTRGEESDERYSRRNLPCARFFQGQSRKTRSGLNASMRRGLTVIRRIQERLATRKTVLPIAAQETLMPTTLRLFRTYRI